MNLQRQYDAIYRYFKTTAEPYDELEWDGKTLQIWLDDKIIETYAREDLVEFITGF